MIATVFAFALGILGWSLAEYCIHRWLGHDRRFFPNPFGSEHSAHHGRGNYFAATWKKLATAAAIAALLWWPASRLAGPVLGGAWLAGFLMFYGYYEVLHRLEHVLPGAGTYGRWARRHHFFHHFHDPSKNHGVTSPIWDHVFGTLAPSPAVIHVPEKLAPFWLCDPATGDVWPHHKPQWELRKSRSHATKSTPSPDAAVQQVRAGGPVLSPAG